MKFDTSLKNNYNDVNLSLQRKKLLNFAKNEIESLKEEMFDVYNIDDIYLLESFYDNTKPFIEMVPVILEMNFSDFCLLVDSKSMNYKFLNIIVKTNDEIYSFSKDNLKKLKEGLHYDKIHKL